MARAAAGLGVKLVIVIGARLQINQAMRATGVEPRYEHGYRVTDAASLQAAIRAAGHARMEVESRLSKVRACCISPCAPPDEQYLRPPPVDEPGQHHFAGSRRDYAAR